MNLSYPLEFRRLVAGCALSTLGDAGVRMLLVWITLEQRGVAAMSGVFIAAAAASVFGPYAGRSLDRYPARYILSATCVIRFALILTLVFMDSQSIARYAVIFAFLNALFTLAFGPAVAKTIPAMFTPDKMPEANALCGASFLIASAAGPALGGAVLGQFGPSTACAVFASVLLVAAPLLHFITFPITEVNDGKEKIAVGYAEGFRILATMPVILVLIALGTALNFALAPINVALAPLMLSLGTGPQGFGFAMALFVAGAVGGNFLAGRLLRSASWERSVFASLGAIAFGLVAVSLSQIPLQAAIGILVIGAAIPFFQIPAATQLQRSVPSANAGQVFASVNSVTLFAGPLAAAAAGALLKWFSPPLLFSGAAALCAVLCLGWGLFRRQQERAAPLLDSVS